MEQSLNCNTPNWAPLEKAIGTEKCGEFMFMYSTVVDEKTICAYKHINTRLYLCIDTEGAFYSYDGGRNNYSPVEREKALAYVYDGNNKESLIAFEAYGAKLELRKTTYYMNKDRIALIAVRIEDEKDYGVLTVNFHDAFLEEGEIAIRDWEENVEMARAVFATGFFENTGKTIKSGFVRAPVWKFKDPGTINKIPDM
jgi:hypothetical protein